jgi:hypothetical protein
MTTGERTFCNEWDMIAVQAILDLWPVQHPSGFDIRRASLFAVTSLGLTGGSRKCEREAHPFRQNNKSARVMREKLAPGMDQSTLSIGIAPPDQRWSAIGSIATNTTTSINKYILGGSTQSVYQGNAQKTPDTSGKILITIPAYTMGE